MGKHKKRKCDARQIVQSQDGGSVRIPCGLSDKDLRPTEREKQLLQDLFDWQERSRKTHWVLGQPLGVRP